MLIISSRKLKRKRSFELSKYKKLRKEKKRNFLHKKAMPKGKMLKKRGNK
jgi:hypothetical protein